MNDLPGIVGAVARVTVVSDSHLSERAPESQRNWRAVLRHVQRTAPDLVIHLGDLSLDGAHDPRDLHYARTELERLAVPWLAVPGNHDVGDNPGAADNGHGTVGTSRLKRWLDVVGADRWAADAGGWRLLGVNAQLFGSALPAEDDQWAWLESELAPAWSASRIPPAHALMPAARAPRRGGRRIRTVTGLAVTGIVRTPGRSAVAATGLAVGVAGLTVLLAAHVSFATSIGDSELAGLVTGSTRGTDLISVLLTIALSAGGVADLTYLNLRERAGELAALAASGWGRRQLGRLLTSEAVVTAGTGSVAGAAIGLTVAGVALGLTLPVLATAALAAAGGTAVTLAAVITVLLFTSGRPLAAVLAADE